MTKEEFVKGATFLAIAYNKEFTQEQLNVWYEFFKEEDFDNFRVAVKRIIPKKQFIPSIAELKQEITYIKTPALQLKADEEWEKVKDAIRKYGYYQSLEAMQTFNPITANVIRALGGFEKLCLSTEGDWLRKNFIDIFNTKMNNVEEVAILSEPQLTLPELMRMKKLKDKENTLLLEEN